MYEKSDEYLTFAVAGFSHHDGYKVASQIKPGRKLRIKPEFDNPYDPNALALYIGKTLIGYVPRKCNQHLAQLIYYGHGDAFSCRIIHVNELTDDLEGAVIARIIVNDARPSKKHHGRKHH